MQKMLDNVYWVGAVDWSVREFHGYNTQEGTSYNSYIQKCDENCYVLFDTVKYPFAETLWNNINEVCNPQDIKYIVMNHAEVDHSSSLQIILPRLTQKPQIITNAKCKEVLCKFYPSLSEYDNWKLITEKDTVTIGKYTFNFLLTPLIHWPDSQMTYCNELKCAYTIDAFGQHLATSERWADQLDVNHVIQCAKEYNANILGHLPQLIKNALPKIAGLGFETILCAHGVCWRGETVSKIVNEYVRFANKQYENKVVVIYDTMYESTAKIAESIAKGIHEAGYEYKLLDLKHNHITRIALELYDAKAFVIGSPTLNMQVMPLVAETINYAKGLKLMDQKPCFCFGSYGWAKGRSVTLLTEEMKQMGAQVQPQFNIDWQWNCTEQDLQKAYENGKQFIENIKSQQK